MAELYELTAREQRDLVLTREISATELLEAHLAHIDAVNPALNAIVTLVPEHARDQARQVDEKLAAGDDPGILAGLPVAHKDLTMTRGIRTTFGSRLYADFIPDQSDLIVDRLNSAGAVTIGKTNTPEWGAGSQTFNDVFGATRNPWDTSKTCGGSSGGAAVALAARMLPIADGSDMGGSLRNPASFCHVVGFRVSAGRVPTSVAQMAWSSLSVLGPMARNVEDCALMLAAIAGPDDRSPIALSDPGATFLASLDQDPAGTRVAIAPDFGGRLPVDGAVQHVVKSTVPLLHSLGCQVTEGCPDFRGADEAFKTLRAWSFAASHGENIKRSANLFKETIIWNVEQGLKLSGSDIARAEILRTRVMNRVIEFMGHHDFLILPVAQVPPFSVETEYVTDIAGTSMETYIDWMKSCYYITVTGLPAISLPCGFTGEGLPVGIQIVGRPRGDLELLKFARSIERALDVDRIKPPIIT
ncbi:MAG: amidase [Proteobacteria bacterium]|nr:amidase [Pseudomonadota bacterium]